MNAGDGETSSVNTSAIRSMYFWEKPAALDACYTFDTALRDMSAEKDLPKCLKIVDLGCSSWPNTLSLISHIMDTIERFSEHKNVPQQVEVFLNNLPDSDFNKLFKQLPGLSRKNKKLECFVYGAPGSFYGKLFPNNSIHFAYSSYCLQWLSQIPEGLGKKNKNNIYIARTSPAQVFEAYSKQFQKDFSMFLKLRGEEIRSGGRMVLTFLGRNYEDPSYEDEFQHFTLLAETLSDMVDQGLLREHDLHSFNMPFYAPCLQEITAAIRAEGSFDFKGAEGSSGVAWDFTSKGSRVTRRLVKHVTECIRTFMEPMLAAHFGSSINIDWVFDDYAMKLAERLPRVRFSTHTISLTRKLITDLK